jgi:ATP-dependent helicase/nuclease subunit A
MTDLYAFRRNVVLVASAGTGKTHALVGVILHALLGVSELSPDAVDPVRVAATTFSRKAAAEINERLVIELERLAFGDEHASHYAGAIDAAARARDMRWGHELRAERARRALAGMERSTIGTLHSLAYGVVRKHALAVGLAPSLSVASEDDNEAWAVAAVMSALAEHATREPEAVRDLFRLMRGRDRAEAELVRLLLALDEDGRAASTIALPEGDADTLDRSLRDLVAASGAEDAYARADVDSLIEAVADAFGERSVRGDEARRSLRDGLGGSSNRERATSFVHAWAARHRVLPTSALIRAILASAQTHLADLHAHAGAIGFGATLRLARDALRDDPVAAQRASGAFEALLVDEFQDTSRVQVDLIKLLWERAPRSRAPGSMPLPGDFRGSGLLVVGDRKQSIYAFRGADVGVFVTTCIELAGEAARIGLGIEPRMVIPPVRTTADFFVLRENHRASSALIEFVNAFSRECLRPESNELFEARYVEETDSLLAARPESSRGQRITWLRPPGAVDITSRLEDATLIAAYIAGAVGRDKADDGTRLSFRDFAVLAQSSEMLDAAAFALARVGAPHVVAGRGFFAAREVQDLLDVLRWIDRPDDRAALLSVLRGPCVALDDRTLLALTEPHRGLVTNLDRWGSLERRTLVEEADREPLERAHTTLGTLAEAAERIGPGRTLREAVRAFELEATLMLLPRGPQRIANVRKLLRMADDAPTIRALLDRVARAEARAREPEAATFAEDDDAVRLLTIHASKGLAFRVVLIPELRAAQVRSQSTMMGIDLRATRPWLSTKILDERGEPVSTPSLRTLTHYERARARADRRRLMYVAVTRARERLVFVGAGKPSRTTPHFGSVVATLADAGKIDVEEVAPALPIERSLEPTYDVSMVRARPPHTTEITIAPTGLQDFDHCARRFELVHLLRLPEPTPRALGRFRADGVSEVDARREGHALHALLERIDRRAFGASDAGDQVERLLTSVSLDERARKRVVAAATRFLESDFARAVQRESADIQRERGFVTTVVAEGMTVTLRGAMDLVVTWPSGDVDIVDYKSSRDADGRTHALQLDVYAYAMQREGGGGRMRSGAMFLGADGPCQPRFRASVNAAKLEAKLAKLATLLVAARSTKRFPRAAPKTCHAIGCGYFTLCHPVRERRQLVLFP